jgi:hypothetical protein
MGRNNPAFDTYIARAQPFAQPILKHIRAVVHRACPDVVEELKWSTPAFTHKGLLCGMAAFKEHARSASGSTTSWSERNAPTRWGVSGA